MDEDLDTEIACACFCTSSCGVLAIDGSAQKKRVVF
jgi:hypothetical protein